MKPWAIPLVLVFLFGCVASNPRFGSPESIPQGDAEQLMQASIRHAVVEATDVPDLGFVTHKRNLVLQNVRGPFFQWSAEPVVVQDSILIDYAPQFRDLRIELASPSEIAELARIGGGFLYLAFGDIDIIGDSANVELGFEWARSPDEVTRGVFNLSGGGYQLVFHKANGEWVFDRAVRTWQY